ncbi:MAG: hypothetical protein CM15mP84_05270 [Cellvibrionales bacterium]|nr:MAG: hypothetical protein CM15mP84_05270 [Cellvibrionales bacterium]
MPASIQHTAPGLDPPRKPPKPASTSVFCRQGHGVSPSRHRRLAPWPEYGEVIGGRFFYAPAECRGKEGLDSGIDTIYSYLSVQIRPPYHRRRRYPLFLTDELYLYEVFGRTFTRF